MVSLAYKICRNEVAKAGNIGVVAKKIGYSRSSLNLYLLGRYTAKTDEIEKKIIGTFTDKILCPFSHEIINKKQCEEVEQKTLNTCNPMLLKLQIFCQTCPVRHDFKAQFKNKYEGKNND